MNQKLKFIKKIKIIHILNSVGGVDVSLRLILENCNPEKVENIIIHGEHDTKSIYINKNGKPLKEYKLPIQREISIFKDLKAIYNTIKILKIEKPNIIHAHSAKGGVIARTASLFYKIKVLHTPQAYSYLSSPKGFKRIVFLGIEKALKSFRSILVASSTSELNRGLFEVGYKKQNTELFNNSINPITINSEDKISSQFPKKYICSVGRPSFQKNIEMMIKVIKELKKMIPEIHLVLLGVGEYSPNKNKVEELIIKYKLKDNVTLIPWIAREKIFQIISKSELYLSTARYEGLPYSIIEALAIGKACIVTNCDGNRDLVKNEINGYVVEENEIKSMANRIFELYNDNKKRKKFELNSFDSFNLNYNIEKNIVNIETIYKKYSN